jgi:uncharacterized membrane protein HdeD (DUF308 family)
MYIAIVSLTMLLLPACSIIVEHSVNTDVSIVSLIGRWFVFWGVGVRLGLAGLRQIIQPVFTARDIFKITGDEALPVIRELGFANVATGVVALTSIAMKTFVLPAAIAGGIFYAMAGLIHVTARGRSRNETIAMVSDFFVSAVLGLFTIATLAGY